MNARDALITAAKAGAVAAAAVVQGVPVAQSVTDIKIQLPVFFVAMWVGLQMVLVAFLLLWGQGALGQVRKRRRGDKN